MRISLRLKLVLLSFVLLLFPLLGMRLNTILKNSLITSQEDTLSLTAQAVTVALANRNDLFEREQFYSLNQGRDLYLFQLSNTIRLDGNIDDWQPELARAEHFGVEHLLSAKKYYTSETLSFRHLAGKQGRFLYALFDVHDDHVLYRRRNTLQLDRSDHLKIVIEDEQERRNYIIPAHKPGWVNAFLLPDDPGKFPVVETSIMGVWKEKDTGYILEIRIPLEILGSKLAFTVADIDTEKTGSPVNLIGTASTAENNNTGWLLTTSAAIEGILRSLDRPLARIRIIDRNQRIRAQVGGLHHSPEPPTSAKPFTSKIMTAVQELFRPLYRFFTTSFSEEIEELTSQPTALDFQGIEEALHGTSSITRYLIKDDQVEVMAAITPLQEGKTIIGAVVVEQTTNSILALSNRLIEETVTISVLTFVLGGGALLLFAFRISSRIRRLRNQAARAISKDGRIRSEIKRSQAGDEIGDLNRAMDSMLKQLKQQIEHREQMADNLEHEMRTPLAGIAASLKNMEQEMGDQPRNVCEYLRWAERDVQRLEELLTQIREATTLKDALQQEDMECFDLGRAVSIWLEQGWQTLFPEVVFVYTPPEEEVQVNGDPGRLRQALDKLVENAVSFHLSDTPVTLLLEQSQTMASLAVMNHGRTIDPAMQQQIFNSMVSSRTGQDDRPHLGLGLYIASTILQHHGGTVSVHNLEDDVRGVVFTLTLPMVP